MNGLLAAADVFVSLHRSEGFGFGLAEAMLLGKQAIGTDYSGNTDFLNTETGYLVPYRLVRRRGRRISRSPGPSLGRARCRRRGGAHGIDRRRSGRRRGPALAPARPSSRPITALPRWASRCATAWPLSASSMGKREPEPVAKTALITGISGQDGAYLARALLARGYRVVGAFRRTSGTSVGRLEELGISGDVELVDMELLEASNLRHVLNKLKPDEIYNLAAQSFVGLSFEQPLYTSGHRRAWRAAPARSHARGLPRRALLSGFDLRDVRQGAGDAAERKDALLPAQPLRGGEALRPLERGELPRGARPLRLLRHPVQSREPVARTRLCHPQGHVGLARVALGQEEMVHVGNLEAKRDWGFAGEYVEGMWMMLQQEKPGDYVIATGRSSSVRDFIDGAATGFGFDIEWTGNGIDARAVDRRSGRTVVAVDPKLYRPAEVDALVGDARKAEAELGWEAKTSLEGLIQMMVKADYDRVKTGIIRC